MTVNRHKILFYAFETYQIFVLPCTLYCSLNPSVAAPWAHRIRTILYRGHVRYKIKGYGRNSLHLSTPCASDCSLPSATPQKLYEKIQLFNRKVKTFLDFFVFGGLHIAEFTLNLRQIQGPFWFVHTMSSSPFRLRIRRECSPQNFFFCPSSVPKTEFFQCKWTKSHENKESKELSAQFQSEVSRKLCN